MAVLGTRMFFKGVKRVTIELEVMFNVMAI